MATVWTDGKLALNTNQMNVLGDLIEEQPAEASKLNYTRSTQAASAVLSNLCRGGFVKKTKINLYAETMSGGVHLREATVWSVTKRGMRFYLNATLV